MVASYDETEYNRIMIQTVISQLSGKYMHQFVHEVVSGSCDRRIPQKVVQRQTIIRWCAFHVHERILSSRSASRHNFPNSIRMSSLIVTVLMLGSKSCKYW